MNIWAVGRNYSDHAKEMGSAVPSKPMIFLKAGSTVIHDESVPLWRGSQDIHHEIEIALRFSAGGQSFSAGGQSFGGLGQRVSGLGQSGGRFVADDPNPSAHGYADLKFDAAALVLDLTARDLQAKLKADGHPWTLAKSFIASCPMGPAIEISSEVPHFEFEFSVNGAVRQTGKTEDMVFGFEQLRRYCLECFPVRPGDWLLTGTPSGVGRLVPGDKGQAWMRSSLGHESQMTWNFR